ncbi:MAG: fibrinogen-like YCDxxxxGGGW domain-containing protein [Polyangiaceae bacterium]
MLRSRYWLPLTSLLFACAGPEFTGGDQLTSEVKNGEGGAVGAGGSVMSDKGGAAFAAGGRVASGGAADSSGGAVPSSEGGSGGSVDVPASGGASAGGGASASGGSVASSGGALGSGGAAGSAGSVAQAGAASVGVVRACRELPTGSPSGVYGVDPDGSGSLTAFDASCDMTTDGGGWTLVLNYVHKGLTNPALVVHKAALPLFGSDVLGTDESGSVHWGHAATSLVTSLAPSALRIQGRTSAHARVIDVVSADKNCITYFSGGATNCKGLASSFTPSLLHSASLPAKATAFMSGKGDLAMTEFPFYVGGTAHWGIHGENARWEVDSTPVTGQLGYLADTIHRVWIR